MSMLGGASQLGYVKEGTEWTSGKGEQNGLHWEIQTFQFSNILPLVTSCRSQVKGWRGCHLCQSQVRAIWIWIIQVRKCVHQPRNAEVSCWSKAIGLSLTSASTEGQTSSIYKASANPKWPVQLGLAFASWANGDLIMACGSWCVNGKALYEREHKRCVLFLHAQCLLDPWKR